MKQVRVSDDVYTRLQVYADGRSLGKAIERLLDAVVERPTFPRIGNIMEHFEAFEGPLMEVPLEVPSIRLAEGHSIYPLAEVPCTCVPSERAKGRHSKSCPTALTQVEATRPMRGK
jgi:hypothetical protein